MKKSIAFIAAASCFTLGTTLAYAKPKAHDMQGTMREQWADQHFKEMDGNGDGDLTKAEFDAFHTKHFQEIDANKDGKLTREEMREGHRDKMEASMNKRFDEADTNHDGTLSREEAGKMSGIPKRFDRIDTNKDGKLSREETEAAMARMRRPD